jgi:TfoX/Sxy family transcriptional regulator of competence genes
MAYNEKLADKLREELESVKGVEEKKMFNGLTFMVNDKMCICVSRDSLLCRFDPERQEEIMGKKGVRPMVMRGKEFKGYAYIDEEGFKSKKDFDFWVDLCLEYNPKAKSSKKKKQ